MEQYPPNSRKERASTRGPQRVERVVSKTAVRRSRPLGQKFKGVMFGGDFKTAVEYMVYEVVIPEAKDMLVDAVTSGFSRLVHGERMPRRRSGPGFMQGGYGPTTNYGSLSRGQDRPSGSRMMTRQARARHDFGELILSSRQDAEETLDRMFDALSQYGEVTQADVFALTGVESSHVDTKWGWEELPGARVGRARGGGYTLELPQPIFLK